MLLSESYKNRLQELAGIFIKEVEILAEAEDLYANSSKRVKFDMNIMKQAIEGGFEVGFIFQSNNDKYKMPIWKTRIVQPVAMGYGKNGQLLIRGIHVEGQSEKKAIETTNEKGKRKGSAQAFNEWRLFKANNIKSMFFTGRMFSEINLPGYNPNDSAMTNVLISFSPETAKKVQDKLGAIKNGKPANEKEPIETPNVNKPQPFIKKTEPVVAKPNVKQNDAKQKKIADDTKKLQSKIDKLNKLF